MKKYYALHPGRIVVLDFVGAIVGWISITLLSQGNYKDLYLVLGFYLAAIILFLCAYRYSGKLYINKEGVKHSGHKLKWNDIKRIGVIEKIGYRFEVIKFLYFTTKSSVPYKLGKNSDDLIYVEFRGKLLQEIRKHWAYAIEGLEKTKFDDRIRERKSL